MKKIIVLILFLLMGCSDQIENEEIFMKQSDVLGVTMEESTVGFLVPLYLYPTDDYSEYERIISVKEQFPDLPIIVIINPHNGPGEYDKEYVTLVDDLSAANITMIGYVHASYGSRSLLEIEEDINTFISLYPDIKGFFIDEVDSGGNINYYKSIVQLTGERNFVVGNPGTHVDQKYFDVFDILVVSEMMYDDITVEFLTPTELDNIPKIQKSVISYNTPNELDAIWITNYASWIYITEYDIYQKLTNHFEELAEMVYKQNEG